MDADAWLLTERIVLGVVGVIPKATDLVRLLEHGDAMAGGEEFVGGDEPGGPGPDDRDVQGVGQIFAATPPSTLIISPEMNRDSSHDRNSTRFATSCG